MWKAVTNISGLTTRVVKPNSSQSLRWDAVCPPISAVIFSLALLVYGLTPTHLNTFDAVAYANQIGLAAETGKLRPLFHPHHLLFNALGFVCWRFAQVLGYEGGPLAIVQEMNAVLGAVGLALYHAALRRLSPLGTLSLLIALCLGGSFGYWICATDGRVNMPSLVLMIAAFYCLLRFRETPNVHLAAGIGTLAGAALLFHESAGLFGIVGATGVFFFSKSSRRCLFAYGAAWGIAVILPYVLVGTTALHFCSLAAFHEWAGAYTERGWWWDFRILHNLRLDLFALRHAIFVEPMGRAVLALTPLHVLGSAGLCVFWVLYLGALIGGLCAGAMIAIALPKLFRSPDRPLTLTCLTWIGLYAAFFTVWCPGAFIFWVPTLVPLGALMLISVEIRWGKLGGRGQAPPLRGIGVWVLLLTLLNFSAAILPYLKPSAGLSQWVAADIAAHTPPRALIIVAGVGDDAQCEVDIPYFAHRPVLSLHGTLAHARTYSGTQTTLRTALDKAFGAGRNVYVLDELWTNRRTVAALHHQNPEISAPLMQSLFDEYQLVPSWHGPRGWVWKLTPPARIGKSGRIISGPRRTTRGNELTFRRPITVSSGPPRSA